MELYFVTGNKHKFKEIAALFKDSGITLKQWTEDEKIENKDESLEQTAMQNAEKMCKKIKKPVAIDDTGVFFEAYPKFPGANPKWVFHALGYVGLLKLLEGKSRNAYFKTVVGYCEPGKKPIAFTGELHGTIATKAVDLDKDVLPYDRIFLIQKNKEQVFRSSLPEEEVYQTSHRTLAFRKLLEYLKNRK